MSTRKSDSYTALANFNLAADATLEAVRALSSFLNEANQRYVVSGLEEARSATNIDVLTKLHAEESKDVIVHGISKREAQLNITPEKPEPKVNGKAVQK